MADGCNTFLSQHTMSPSSSSSLSYNDVRCPSAIPLSCDARYIMIMIQPMPAQVAWLTSKLEDSEALKKRGIDQVRAKIQLQP